MLNADRFMAVVDRYTDIQELTPEIVREFIEKIVVHERSERWKKKNYTQQVDIYFNFWARFRKAVGLKTLRQISKTEDILIRRGHYPALAYFKNLLGFPV